MWVTEATMARSKKVYWIVVFDQGRHVVDIRLPRARNINEAAGEVRAVAAEYPGAKIDIYTGDDNDPRNYVVTERSQRLRETKEGSAMRASDVRSYGSGKFYTILDSYVYDATNHGGADEEESYEDGGGWYGLVNAGPETTKFVMELADDGGEPLNDDEVAELRSVEKGGIILFERSDGIVETEWFTSKAALDNAWAAIVAHFDEIRAEQEDEG